MNNSVQYICIRRFVLDKIKWQLGLNDWYDIAKYKTLDSYIIHHIAQFHIQLNDKNNTMLSRSLSLSLSLSSPIDA